MRLSLIPLAVLFAVLAASRSVAADVSMFVNDSANRLLIVDIDTGQAERVGTTNAQFTDIAFSPDGRLYGVTARYVYELDAATGWSTLIGSHGYGEPGHAFGIDSLTFASDGTLYAAGNDVLITIDPESGIGSQVGTLSGFRSAGDLVVDNQDRLFLTTDVGMLVEVDPAGAGALPIGNLPYTDIYALGGTQDGALYGIRAANTIVSVNPDTGEATFAGTVEADFLMGYAWGGSVPDQFAPAPASLLIFLSGSMLLIARRARRHR
jgi:hypothetical protein